MNQTTQIQFVSNITGNFFTKSYEHIDAAELREFVQAECNALDAIATVGQTVMEPTK